MVLNLAIWFAIHVLFGETHRLTGLALDIEVPVLASLNPVAALLCAAALIAVFVLRLSLFAVLGGAAAAGILLHLAGLA